MLKITKGLKKKKKGKKSKHKEEELFKPEELEAYRREHQQHATDNEAESSAGDEWKKFQALTAGVDDILKKTQGDLDRIKSTSFFQRIPPASQVKTENTASRTGFQEDKGKKQEVATVSKEKTAEELGIVEVSESESEEEGEDDIFDTTFVDAIESGEVKLAYIPESPDFEEAAGDDPFDTSIADKAILGPAVNTKGRKLVPLGSAVEVLTGRVELATCATGRRTGSRRNLRQQKDLLLGSFDFDNNGNTAPSNEPEQHKSLLDDDSLVLSDVPIELGASLHLFEQVVKEEEPEKVQVKGILDDFDVLSKHPTPTVDEQLINDEEDEFALLAAESFAKNKDTGGAKQTQNEIDNFEENVDDPFDTTFADNILPGKAELKLIENEILNVDINIPDRSRIEEKYVELIKSNVSIHVTNPTGDRESLSSLDRVDESNLTSLQPAHRDLLGGSNTDLSKIGDDVILPSQVTDDSFSDYSDPFDTSIVDQVSLPGQAELKFIEKELLGETDLKRSFSDPEFDPRAEEKPVRPGQLDINVVKNVKFAVPSPRVQTDLLGAGEDIKHTKPLTPYYVRENSIPDLETDPIEVDPFDTSFVAQLAPGKAELKLIEDEFVSTNVRVNAIQVDDDFDPRGNESLAKTQEVTVPCTKLKQLKIVPPSIDLLSASEDVAAKVLTPAVENQPDFELTYSDPFDTSIANNILPGKAELKLLENELMQTSLKRNLTDPDFDPRDAVGENKTIENTPVPFAQPQVPDLFDQRDDSVATKPLTPVTGVSFEIGDNEEDIDPFDTSVANNLVLGRTELKLLESELIK